nr:hypothetical protein [Tanacetum cinerariifolium]
LMESKKMTGSMGNNDAAKVYVVDGKPLKSILKKPIKRCCAEGNQHLREYVIVAHNEVNGDGIPEYERSTDEFT